MKQNRVTLVCYIRTQNRVTLVSYIRTQYRVRLVLNYINITLGDYVKTQGY